MSLSTLSVGSARRARSVVIPLMGDDIADIDARWPIHWMILVVDVDGNSKRLVVDERDVEAVLSTYRERGFEVAEYSTAPVSSYMQLDREMSLVEQVPSFVAEFLDDLPKERTGQISGLVRVDQGYLGVEMNEDDVVEAIGLAPKERFLLSIDNQLRLSIAPSDPMDGESIHASRPDVASGVVIFERQIRPGEWFPEIQHGPLRFDVFGDRSMASAPIFEKVGRFRAPSIVERASMHAHLTGHLAFLGFVAALGALG